MGICGVTVYSSLWTVIGELILDCHTIYQISKPVRNPYELSWIDRVMQTGVAYIVLSTWLWFLVLNAFASKNHMQQMIYELRAKIFQYGTQAKQRPIWARKLWTKNLTHSAPNFGLIFFILSTLYTRIVDVQTAIWLYWLYRNQHIVIQEHILWIFGELLNE